MPTTKGLYTTNRTYVGMLRGTYATGIYVPSAFVADQSFSFNSLLLTGETDYLPFNADNSLNNLNVTVFGDAKSSNFSPYTGGYYSAYFDGTGDYLTVQSSSNLAFDTGDFCVEMWYYQPTIAFAALISNSVQNGSAPLYGDAQFEIQISASTYYPTVYGWSTAFLTSSVASTAGRWNHIAVCRNGTTASMFLNGVRVATATVTNNFSSTNSFNIGRQAANSGYLIGYISNLRISKGSSIYDPTSSYITIPTSPLTAVSGTQLLICESNRFIDNSTNNFTITRNGDTKIDPASPFDVPASFASYGSVYLDGTGDYLSSPGSTAFTHGTGAFTVEYWVYQTVNTGGYAQHVGSAIGSSGWAYGASSVTPYMTSSTVGYTASVAYSLFTWNHIAWCRDSSNNVRCFLNGVLVYGPTSITTNITETNFGIGQSVSGTAYNSTGYIADLRVVKGVAIYTGNFSPPNAPLSISGSPIQYTLTANVNTSFPAANTSLSLLQYSQPHNNSTFLDKSNFKQLITRNGNSTQGSFSPYGQNWSGYFDGSSYIITASSTAFGFGTGDYTVEFWYYSADDSYSYAWDFRAAGGGSGQTKPLMSIDATNTILYIGTTTVISATGVPNRTWGHVAVVRQTGVTRIYINGILSGTPYTGSQDFGSTNTLSLSTVGDSPGYSTTELVGNMSNFRVVKGAAVYTGNFTPPTAPLTTTVTAGANVTAITSANVSYLGLNSYNLADTSINKISQTITGTVVAQTFSPFGRTANASPILTGGSLYIDGTDYLNFPASNPALKMGTGDFTIEFWVYPTTAPNNNWSPFLTIGTSGGGQEIRISQNLNGAGFGYLIPNNSNNADVYPGFGTLPLFQWSHIALVRAGSTVTMYRNGLSVGSTTSVSFNHTNTTVCRIGYPQPAYADGSTVGYISDFRIVKNAVYIGNFAPPSLPLTLSGNSLIYSNTTNVNTTFSVANTAAMLNFTDAAIKDATTYFNLETVADAKLGFETAYSGSYYSNYFDGSGDYLTTPGSASNLMTGDFTVEFWAYQTTAAAASGLIGINNTSSSGGANFGLYLESDGRITFFIAGNTTTYTSSAVVLTPHIWKHIAFVRSGSTNTIYVDGVSVLTNSGATSWSGTPVITVGRLFGDNTGATFYGYLTNVRVVKGTAVYTAAFTPPTSPLTAISGTHFLSCQSNRFIDNSTNNFAITVNGQTAVRSFNPFQRNTGSSLFFDGSGDYASIVTSPSLNFGTGDFTVEAWVYPSQLSVDWFIISASGSGGFFFGYAPSSGGYGWGRTAVAWDYQPATSKTSNAWQHVAVTRSGTSMRLFVNGTQQGITQTNSTAYNLGTTSTTIGSQGANYYLTGYIDDLRITRGNARYTANFTPSITMLPVR